jgi:hypothetical protein
MAEIDELFSCFDEENEEQQPTVPVVMDVDDKIEDQEEKT